MSDGYLILPRGNHKRLMTDHAVMNYLLEHHTFYKRNKYGPLSWTVDPTRYFRSLNYGRES